MFFIFSAVVTLSADDLSVGKNYIIKKDSFLTVLWCDASKKLQFAIPLFLVIPAKAGIHAIDLRRLWIPAFAGMTSERRDDGRNALMTEGTY
jgi:hypothetical protein